ncbi:alpha-amylase family glycosyl hydrolase [Reichenbachiella agarivorans]|uniref:Alpha-amylase n=1 Tax=Reichenbachiella agarivorans TaxID=2979464 RepID=A0ABY6CSL3_9BACT|nr:alpha-amylase family glycosyl hydrolase [Reichenbachiella agarivorans]UXP31275.1 alpha-amylase family glycosyl hydrolase [Reichenbachiella agarivorans]
MSYNNAVFYEIFVQSFADSNGDGVGDIPGMTAKLDYLVDLGITAIWLMPMSPSPSYHKYDVTDYVGIHSDYGTMEDFKTFIHEAHAREIRVVMDFVINHSSSEHPWFVDAKTGKDAKYRDYYVWADKDSIAQEIAKKETSFDSDNIRQWHPVTEEDTVSEHYYGFFYGGMPDFNYDNPAVRKEFYDAGKFWLSHIGVDGFRLDAAKHIYPDDRAVDSHAFWKEFKSEMQKVNPDVYLMGEVWSDAKNASPYAAGFTSLFNFDRAFSILESINAGEQKAAKIAGHGYEMNADVHIADVINESLPWFKSYNPDFIEASFLSNHDQNRVASVLGGKSDKIKLSAAILFTLPGTPYIYYGEELGMLGMKPDENIREPMLWDISSKDAQRTEWMKSKYSTDSTVVPAKQQMADGQSIYNTYKELIALKKTSLFSQGTIAKISSEEPALLAYSRSYGDSHAMIYHNLSAKEIIVNVSAEGYKIGYENGDAVLTGGYLTLGSRASLILIK